MSGTGYLGGMTVLSFGRCLGLMFAFWWHQLVWLFDGVYLGGPVLFLGVGALGWSNWDIFLGVGMGPRFWWSGALWPCVWCGGRQTMGCCFSWGKGGCRPCLTVTGQHGAAVVESMWSALGTV